MTTTLGPYEMEGNPQGFHLTADLNYVWDTNTLDWIEMTQPGASGGGAVTIADGADVAQGSVGDDAWVAGDGTVIALLKKIASPGGGGLTDAELRATPVPVSGTFYQATQPVSGTFYQATQPVSIAAQVATKETRSSSPSQSSVASSATSVTLLASNANRLGATIYNDSTAILRVKLGASASSSSFDVALGAVSSGIGGYFEVPYQYTGIIDGIWDSANGNARILELT